jgi:putative flippase GtrA
VTCPSLLRRRPEDTDVLGGLPHSPLHQADEAGKAVSARVRGEDTFAQFIRFVLVGGSSTAVYSALFLGLEWLGYLPAHIVATVISSVLANEMHRRLTFRADERVGWLAAQIEAGGVSVFGLVATTVALRWLDASAGAAQPALQISLVVAITGLIGLTRFIALRWIFRPTGVRVAQ